MQLAHSMVEAIHGFRDLAAYLRQKWPASVSFDLDFELQRVITCNLARDFEHVRMQ